MKRTIPSRSDKIPHQPGEPHRRVAPDAQQSGGGGDLEVRSAALVRSDVQLPEDRVVEVEEHRLEIPPRRGRNHQPRRILQRHRDLPFPLSGRERLRGLPRQPNGGIRIDDPHVLDQRRARRPLRLGQRVGEHLLIVPEGVAGHPVDREDRLIEDEVVDEDVAPEEAGHPVLDVRAVRDDEHLAVGILQGEGVELRAGEEVSGDPVDAERAVELPAERSRVNTSTLARPRSVRVK